MLPSTASQNLLKYTDVHVLREKDSLYISTTICTVFESGSICARRCNGICCGSVITASGNCSMKMRQYAHMLDQNWISF
jgi:hypothetical protein